MSKCQSKIRVVECSTDPETFTVTSKSGKTTSVHCLAHAVVAERRGQRADLILT